MEDDHPKLLAFAVGLIIALVLWIVMGGVSGILWDYMLLPACDGSLWAGKVIGVRSRDLQLGEALLASGVPDYLVPGALMGWPAEPLEWYFCNQPKTAAHFWQKEKWQIFSRLHYENLRTATRITSVHPGISNSNQHRESETLVKVFDSLLQVTKLLICAILYLK